MKYTARQYVEALIASAPTDVPHAHALVTTLISRLRQERAIRLVPAIRAALEERSRALRGVTLVSATTARPIDSNTLTAELEHALNTKIELHADLDPELLGGATITFGDMRIDASTRTQLQQLRVKLNASSLI